MVLRQETITAILRLELRTDGRVTSVNVVV
jgi:hypothetical protein